MKEVILFLQARIEALEKLNKLQQDLIDDQAIVIDELSFLYKNEKAEKNMLIRNIQVIDEIYEKPLNN